MRATVCLWSDHDYEVHQLDELPAVAAMQVVMFPVSAKIGLGDALMLHCTPVRGDEWIGVFARNHLTGLLALFSCASRDHFLVVADGRGYFCNAEKPQDSSELPCYPIVGVDVAADAELLLVNDSTLVMALGHDGITWTSGRISWDGITFDRIDATRAEGLASDPTGPPRQFVIELSTGEHQGGSARTGRNGS
jgi:hypothetical protein